MQKVEGSSPFSRFEEAPASDRFLRLPARSTFRAGRRFFGLVDNWWTKLVDPGRGDAPRLRAVRYSGGGSHPDSRRTRRTRARQPTRLAVATTPRAVVAVHLRRVLPNPERCGGVV